EVAHNFEAGVNIKWDNLLKPHDAFRAKIVGFRNKVDDYIDMVERKNLPPTQNCNLPFIPVVGCNGEYEGVPLRVVNYYPVQYDNIANATIEGIEFEAMYDARSWFLGIGGH